MDWPPGSQLPANDPRAPYRARDVRAFAAVAASLRTVGLSAPVIYGADTEAGFLLMEALGDEGVTVAGAPDRERYGVVIDALAAIHAEPRPHQLPRPDGTSHRLPRFAGEALMAEIGNFADCFVPHETGRPLSDQAKNDLFQIWSDLAVILGDTEQSWVLFDVQSPNLFWLPEREGLAKVGVIDFQDMFVGPAAYDVASLCQDARVTIPAALERDLRDRYVARRLASDRPFDVGSFADAYAISAALRTTKNLGAFARLASSGKPDYLNHLPRLREYLARALGEPVLSPLALWYETFLTP